MNRILLLIIFCILSCAEKGTFINDDEYVVLNTKSKSNQSFKLSHNQILKIEELIENDVQYFKTKHTKRLMRYDDLYDEGITKEELSYVRQYVLSIDNKHNRIVQINFFCELEEFHENWRKEIAPLIDDGGECYFSFKINLDTNEVLDVTVNGVAINNKTNTFDLLPNT